MHIHNSTSGSYNPLPGIQRTDMPNHPAESLGLLARNLNRSTVFTMEELPKRGNGEGEEMDRVL